MSKAVTIQPADAERLFGMLQQIKQDVAQLEVMFALLRPISQPQNGEDIFAEMTAFTANAPNADDSREAIYTRMPGE